MSVDLSGRSVLIVEDEPLIAIDIAQALTSAHASVVVAATLQEGLRLAEHPTLSAAVLDLILGRDDAVALFERLSARGVPCIIYTGYVEIPAGCAPSAIVRKPARSEALLRALAQVLARDNAVVAEPSPTRRANDP
jgi:DNA-binding NtrC family response regulator